MKPYPLCSATALAMLALPLAAVDGSSPVVEVDGEAITLRQLEDELLQREGVTRVVELVEAELEQIDWQRLGDEELVVRIGDLEITRLDAAAALLRSDGHRVRRELINITLARRAMERAGLDPDRLPQDVVDAELARWEEEVKARAKESYGADIAFADALRTLEDKTVEELVREQGFRMSAGLHELVMRETEVPELDLRDHYAEHFDDAFRARPAVRLQLIRFPFDPTGRGGEPDPKRQRTIPTTARAVHANIAAGKMSFERAWSLFGKAYDPNAEGGAIGWVTLDGERENEGADRVPRAVTERAFDVDLGQGPVLLPPVEHEEGVALVRVLDRRAGQRPAFADIRDQVRRHYIEGHREALTQAYMARLGEQAEVVYDVGELSFDQLVGERVGERSAGSPEVETPAAGNAPP